VDVDPQEIARHYPVQLGLVADVACTLRALREHLPRKQRTPWAPPFTPRASWSLPGLDLVGTLRRTLPPATIVCADVTRLAYIPMTDLPLEHPRTFLHPAGSVAMGYGLPAALGAQAAFPGRKVLAVVGDGGFLMSGMELATAVQEKLPVVVLLVNDGCLSLIKATQERRSGGRFLGVDLDNPDFGAFTRAFGVRYWRAATDEEAEAALREALATENPALVEVRPADARAEAKGG